MKTELTFKQLAAAFVAAEARPCRRRRFPSQHVLCDRGLADPDASFKSSPWIRGAPQNGFARFICRISSRTSRATDGPPDLERQHQ
jgi:hypothetical protein